MRQRVPPPGSSWQRRIAAASAGAFVGVAVAVCGQQLPAIVATAALGAGILCSSLMLAWAADAAEVDVSGRLVIMAVALVAVLPELTVEVELALTRQAQLVTANLTGATRLLLTAALGLPALGAMLAHAGATPVARSTLNPARRLDLAILALAALWELTVVARGRLTLSEAAVFGVLYLLYAVRSTGAESDPPATIGVAAQIAALPPVLRRRVYLSLFAVSAGAVVLIARAFPGELLSAGRAAGINPYLLIQAVIPLFTETPELVVAGTFVRNRRPAQGISLLLASAVIQSTLVLFSVAAAYQAGGGGPAIALSGRERVEMLLTAATMLVAVAALARMEPDRVDGWIMLGAMSLETIFPDWQARLAIALILLVFATDLLVFRRRELVQIAAAVPLTVRLPARRGPLAR
jgi:cation:H+ antiporter